LRQSRSVAFFQIGQQVFFLNLAPVAQRRALGQDQPVALPIELDHFQAQLLAGQRIPAALVRLIRVAALAFARSARHQLRGRNEPAHFADLDDQPALVVAGDDAFEHLL